VLKYNLSFSTEGEQIRRGPYLVVKDISMLKKNFFSNWLIIIFIQGCY
jgi:hypothetical protein